MVYGRLRLFGDLQLTSGPDPHTHPIPIPSARTRALLAYLALHPEQPIDRSQLAFRIWMDSDEETARRALRQHLHRLRRIFAGLGLPKAILTSQGSQLRFRPSLGLWVDALVFQAQVETRRWQIEAIELYRGDLLPGCSAEWLPPLRAALREKYMGALRQQINRAKMQRNYPRALYYARRLLAANPLRESSHRIQMELLYLAGKRAQAIRQYRQLEQLLRRKLNAEPMPQTVDLYRRIQAGTLDADIPLAVASARHLRQALDTNMAVNRSFVARRAELSRLDEALGQALNGRGQAALIEGESGLGKTRLLQTWREMRQTQMMLFAADCEPGKSPFIQALRAGRAQIEWDWFPPQPDWLAQARRLLEGEEDTAVNPKQWGPFILRLAERSGRVVCLLLDDLHQADTADWELLAFLGRRCRQLPLLLAGAYEPHRLSTQAGRIMRSLQREQETVELRLWPLSPTDTARLARILLPDAALDQAFLLRLYYVTEGNPFFITELLRMMQLSGASPQTYLQGEVAWPRTVQAMVHGRIQQISPRSRAVLAIAARAGRHFRFTAVTRAAPHFHEYDILDALDEAIRAGLVREEAQGYAFSHEQIRKQLALPE